MEFQNDVALSSIWQMVSEIMRGKFKREESYQLWFGRVYLAYLDAERALFMCENKLKRDILEKQYREALTEALAEAIGYEPVVEIQVDESLAPEIPDDGSVVSPLKIVREREKEKTPEKEKSRRNAAEQLPLTAFSPSQAELKPAREKSTDTASVFTDAPDISEVEFAEFAESSD
jgi:chromosomal replication initiation ATPase DnaA